MLVSQSERVHKPSRNGCAGRRDQSPAANGTTEKRNRKMCMLSQYPDDLNLQLRPVVHATRCIITHQKHQETMGSPSPRLFQATRAFLTKAIQSNPDINPRDEKSCSWPGYVHCRTTSRPRQLIPHSAPTHSRLLPNSRWAVEKLAVAQVFTSAS